MAELSTSNDIFWAVINLQRQKNSMPREQYELELAEIYAAIEVQKLLKKEQGR
jgi:hypothetical protein